MLPIITFMPIFSFQKGIGYAMSILRLVFGKVNEDFLFALYPMPALRKASEGGRYAPCDFTLLSEVNPVRKSSTFQRGGSHGALNPVFAPLRDKSLTGFALKGIITSPRKRPEVLRGSSPLQAAGLSNGVKDEREKI